MRAQCFPTLYSRKQTFRGYGEYAVDPRRLSAGEKFAQGHTARRPLRQSLTPESHTRVHQEPSLPIPPAGRHQRQDEKIQHEKQTHFRSAALPFQRGLENYSNGGRVAGRHLLSLFSVYETMGPCQRSA